MKKFFLMLMLCPVLAFSQKIAVIDPALKKPVFYIPTVTMDHLLRGSFVMHRDNISNVMDKVRAFRSIIDDRKDIPEAMKSVVTGSTYFTASGSKGDYSIVLDTKIDKMGSYFILADKKESRKENLAAIDEFLAYLEKAK